MSETSINITIEKNDDNTWNYDSDISGNNSYGNKPNKQEAIQHIITILLESLIADHDKK